MRFSERYGYVKPKEAIQRESIDEDLKNRLWSLLDIYLWKMYEGDILISFEDHEFLDNLILNYWYQVFKKSTDQINPRSSNKILQLKNIFTLDLKWYQIYDFIEFTLKFINQNYSNKELLTKVINALNQLLEDEKSAYRIINIEVIEITSEQEIQSIEVALANTNPYSGVQQHLNQALKLMSDRQKPDYRNSIKESISSVESICKIVTNDDKATLGKALKIVEDKFGLHPALKGSLSQLYGYTSDADGIRHAMLGESNLSYIDAKFMLVACTNFINYLIDKTKD